MNSKFCIFHDKDHYAEHEQEAYEDRLYDVPERSSKNSAINANNL